jgi:hypothetical protein
MMKLPENDESGFRFGLEGRRRPGETRRYFGLPEKHYFRLHANVSRVTMPENDESGFKLLFGGTQDTRRDPARFRVKKKGNCSAVFAFNLNIPNNLVLH